MVAILPFLSYHAETSELLTNNNLFNWIISRHAVPPFPPLIM